MTNNVSAPGDVRIPWRLSTLYRSGIYNSTIRFDIAQLALNYISEYWKVEFPRVTTGHRLELQQSNHNYKAAFAWTNGMRIRYSPTANFGRSPYVMALVTIHEVFHALGSSAHLRAPEALMSPNGGTSGGMVPEDFPYMRRYAWRSAARPSLGEIRQRFSTLQNNAGISDEDILKTMKCGCGTSFFGNLFV